jgi:hypothetical protein
MSGDRTAEWLVEQIEAHAPEATEDGEAAMRLAVACAALGGADAQAFGLTLPADPAELPGREEIRRRAIETLKRWIPRLDPDRVARLKKMISEYRVGS